MQFLAPAAWIFSLVIPVIIIFYLLKQKKEDREVSSTLLWQRVLADTVSQTPWQKLRRNLLLFLQLLLALLLILALLRPYMARMQEGDTDLLLLVDTSASMAVAETNGTRMDLARAEVEKSIKSQRPGTRMSLIAVGPVPRVLVNQTEKQAEILSRLDDLQPGYTQANLEPTLSLVSALMKKGIRARVAFFSDGGAVVPDGTAGVSGFEYHRVGSRNDNLALGAFSAGEGDNGLVALTRIDNHGSGTVETTVTLSGSGNVLDIQPVKVDPGKSAHLFWSVPDGVTDLEARLAADDALDLDNTAWLVPQRNKQTKVLLVTEGNIFLEQVLRLSPFLEVHRITPGEYGNIKEDYGLYVFDGFWPLEPPPGQLVVFNPPSSSGLTEEPEQPLKGRLQPGEHPVMEYVSWADVHVAKSRGLRTDKDWVALLQSGGRTVMTAGRTNRTRAVVFGFDLHSSDLALRPAFPILMQNIFNWLLPAGAVREQQVSTGTAVELAVHPQTEEVSLYKPDGGRVQLAPPFPAGKVTDTGKPGLYRIEQVLAGGEKQADYLAVNFVSPQESKVEVLQQLKLGKRDIKASEGIKVNREFWPWLALAALLCLSLEWWVYLRGH